MKVFTFFILALTVFISGLTASPKIQFEDLVINAEQNSSAKPEVKRRRSRRAANDPRELAKRNKSE